MAVGALDKFLDFMKLNPEDEEYEYYDDYEEEEEEEEYRPSKKKSSRRSSNNEYSNVEHIRDRVSSKSSAKITPMRSTKKGSGMEVCVIKPESFEDAREIAETLMSGRTVVLNLEGLSLDSAQRIIDFISGATFAIDGNLQKITNFIFVVTPSNVDVSGDIQSLMDTFDVSSL